jgi:hypothetical protein
MHVQADSGSLENVSASFEAGRRLLAFFPRNEALTALASLEAQFDHHKQFKNDRMAALGWQFGPCPPPDAASQAPPSDPQAALAESQAVTAILTDFFQDDRSWHSVLAHGALSSALKVCGKRVAEESKLSHYAEAHRLQVETI